MTKQILSIAMALLMSISLFSNKNYQVPNETLILNPIEDAYSDDSNSPYWYNFHTGNVLRIDGGSNQRITYLKFDISAVEGTVNSAILDFTVQAD